jgi:hypothetical protein
VLKSDALYIYQNSTVRDITQDKYYPIKAISLKHVTTVQPVADSETDFKLRTKSKSYYLRADTGLLRKEWIASLNNSVFRAKNGANDVRVDFLTQIVIPFENITELSIVRSPWSDDRLKIVVVDHESFLSDEVSCLMQYTFAYFNDIQRAHSAILQQMPQSLPESVSLDPSNPFASSRPRSCSPVKRSLITPTDSLQNPFTSPLHQRAQSTQSNALTRSPKSEVYESVDINNESEGRIVRRTIEKPRSTDRHTWWGHRKTSSDGSRPEAFELSKASPNRHTWWSVARPDEKPSFSPTPSPLNTQEQSLQKEVEFQELFAFPSTEKLIASTLINQHMEHILSVFCRTWAKSTFPPTIFHSKTA